MSSRDDTVTSSEQPALRTGLGWLPALGIAAVGLYPVVHGAYWAIPVTAAAAWAGVGVWRAVRLLGMIHAHQWWRDVEVPAADDTQEVDR
ncbi:hypothetical protein ABZY58_11205 [Micromonospora tulbaghiae]|uniref:hypothetical protein n=1 Tax=Micromonospora tulbaghiae TaxID=479978 RepID=UPI0033BF6476